MRLLYVHVILCINLAITTTIAGDWLNCFIFHDNIKCITAIIYIDGQLAIYIDIDHVHTHACHMTYSFSAKKFGKC